MEHILTTEEVAEYLGVRKTAVYRYVREGKLDCVRISFKERRFTEEQVMEFIHRQTVSKPRPIDIPQPARLPSYPRNRGGDEKTTGDSARALRKEMRAWQS
ncbi:MAG: helix-turn-helix domain-containing protein [Desulfomonile sp.]